MVGGGGGGGPAGLDLTREHFYTTEIALVKAAPSTKELPQIMGCTPFEMNFCMLHVAHFLCPLCRFVATVHILQRSVNNYFKISGETLNRN